MTLRLFGGAVLLLGLLVGAESAGAESLTIQTWGGVWEEGARAVGDAFAEKYDVDVAYEQQENTRLGIAKIRAQAADPQVDIIFSTADALAQAAEENLLVKIDKSLAPNLAQLPEQSVHDTAVDVMNILFGFAYRSDLAPFELTKWEDLTDPRLVGQVASPTASFSSGRWIIMAALINGGDEHNIDPAFEFLAKVKPNISSFVATDGESVKVLTSGEASVLAFGLLSDFAKYLEPGSNVHFVVPTDHKILTTAVGVGIPNPKHAALAHKFLDFIATPEAQTAYCAKITCTPVNPAANAPDSISDFRPPAELLHQADWHVINSSLPAWDDRFKKEIQTR
jgi:putative spermidine/putrescine transport system substrate-binding protein